MNASVPNKPVDAHLIEQTLAALRQQRRRVAELEAQSHAPIAVIGMGCRFPGAANVDSFWQLLDAGRNAVLEVTPDRWDARARYHDERNRPGTIYAMHAGLVAGLGEFDAEFFGITPREAMSLDPQQRWMLECAWEALEDAGIAADRLRDRVAGVFVGATAHDYAARLQERQNDVPIDSYYVSGNALNFIAGRVAYTLGLRGPAMGVDTACSSALTALHLAMQSLRRGECTLALAAGVNLVMAAEVAEASCRSQLLAADGRCKTFDAAADGIVRGEGCGVVVLMPLALAEAAGYPVLAVLRGSAINQDGASSGLMTPNPEAQVDVIRAALADAGIAASDIDYIEAHGTGTALGDPIELRALGTVFASDARATPLLVGSVKTNIGHLESAAGMAGLIKTILSLRANRLPAHIHLKTPTPHVDWSKLPLRITVEAQTWARGERVRRAGVSAFGGSGSNAHVIVEEAPQIAIPAQSAGYFLTLSARSSEALCALRERWAERLMGAADIDELQALCSKATFGRSAMEYRFACSADSAGALVAALQGQETNAVTRSGRSPARRPEVAFLFTGQGAHYTGMGRTLYDQDPAFRAALDELRTTFAEVVGERLESVLWDSGELLANTRYAQPALFAVQYALARAWQSRGIVPDVVLGHSVGEIAAACYAGVFDARTGLALAAARGRLMDELCPRGAMVAIAASSARLQPWLAELPALSIAALNAPEQTVIAGPLTDIEALCARASAAGVRAAALPVSHAFHSPAMRSMLDAFSAHCQSMSFSAPQHELISSMTGAVPGQSLATVEHWIRHVLEPVNFVAALDCLRAEAPAILIEIGPGRTLLGLARHNGLQAQGVASLQRDSEAAAWRTAQVELFCAGLRIDDLNAGRQHYVSAPSYPFQRRQLLIEGRDATTRLVAGGFLGSAQLQWSWQQRRAPVGQALAPLALVDQSSELATVLGCISVAGSEKALKQAASTPHSCLLDTRALARSYAGAATAASASAIAALVDAYRTWASAAPGRPYWLCIDARAQLTPVAAMVNEALQATALSLVWDATSAPLAILRCVSDDWASAQELTGLLALDAASVRREPLWQWAPSALACPRFRPMPAPSQLSPMATPIDTALVTGGFGDLGLAIVERLASQSHQRIVVLSRTKECELDAARAQRLATMRAQGARIESQECDISDRAVLARVISGLADEGRRITDVYHVAGTLQGNSLDQLADAQCFAKIAGAKIDGALALHELTLAATPARFVLISSAAGVWGSQGFSAYAAGNAALNGLARHRAAQGLPVLCLALGPIAQTRMVSGESGGQVGSAGLIGMSIPRLLGAIDALLVAGVAETVLVEADWTRFDDALQTRCQLPWFSDLRSTPNPLPSAQTAGALRKDHSERAQLAALAGVPRRSALLSAVVAEISSVLRLSEQELDADRPLHALGMDSILALEIRDRLVRRFEFDLPATLLFEHPTAGAIAGHLDDSLFAAESSQKQIATSSVRAAPLAAEPIAIIGISARFPGGADNTEGYWQNLLAGVDGIADRPDTRFNVDAWVDLAAAGRDDLPYTMALGALQGIELFDGALFGIAPREARLMDPQQRLVLQGAWHALEDAGIDPMSLRGQRGGVFLGVADNEYLPLLRRHADLTPDLAYLGTGTKLNVIAGRVSYVFGLEGPSIVIDTACSSSAVAAHLACQSLRSGESDIALAGGVNLILDPMSFAPPCRAKMLAVDGRCKSFDQSADGYVRAEGCGLLVLKRWSDAVRDGNKVIALIRGSAVNQDGRSSSLTAPNPASQQRVIRDALANAGLNSADVDYVEAHGTGTQLGDPIELRALAEVFSERRATEDPLWVGSVKSQIGHAEAAAGAAGLIKLALSLQRAQLPANRHFKALNPEAASCHGVLQVVAASRPWPTRGERTGGLSSFGFSGTNAHLILSEAPARVPAPTAVSALPILCLSASSAQSLAALRTLWAQRLASASHADYLALCASSRHTRWSGPVRFAVVASEPQLALQLVGTAHSSAAGVHSGVVGAGSAALRLDLPNARIAKQLIKHLADERAQLLQSAGLADAATLNVATEAAISLLALCRRMADLGVAPAQWQLGDAPTPILGVIAGSLQLPQALALMAGERVADLNVQPALCVCLDTHGRALSHLFSDVGYWFNSSYSTDGVPTVGLQSLSMCDLADAFAQADSRSLANAALLAMAYVHGVGVAWSDYQAPRAEAVPLYPFEQIRHWPHSQSPLVPLLPVANQSNDEYLLGRRQRLPRSNEIRFSRRFTATSPAYVDHHRLLNTVVVPAASHLSMVLSAWRVQGGQWPCTIEDVRLHSPLVLHDTGAREVELILRRDGASFLVELISCDESMLDDDAAWITHMRCNLRAGAQVQAAPVICAAVQAKWQPTISHEAFYAQFWEHGYTLGSSFRWLGEGWVEAGATVRRMQLPQLPDDVGHFDLYPGLIDTCFSVLSSGQLEWTGTRDEDHIFIPVSIERVEFHGWHKAHGDCWAHARAWDLPAADNARAREDICLFEPDGHVVARIVGFETRRAQRDALRLGYRDSQRDWLYRLAWQSRPAQVAVPAGRPIWLVDDGGEFAEALALCWRQNGRVLSRSRIPDGATTADFAAFDDWARLAFESARLALWSQSLDLVFVLPDDGAQLGSAARRGLHALLSVWRMLARREDAPRLRLTVITFNGVGAGEGEKPSLAAAAAWGLLRGLMAEHTESRIVLCDLSTRDALDLRLGAVQASVDGDDVEQQLAWRSGTRYVPRLERFRAVRMHPDLGIRNDARYIVSGGLGGLGEAIVHWLLKAGAGCVQVLARRRNDAVWARLQALAVTHKAALELLIADLSTQALPDALIVHPLALGGVLHAAGTTDDVLAVHASVAQVEQVLAAKWDVGARLAELSRRCMPEFLVMFGSLAATLPAPGQSAYAGANSALDAIARNLRSEGVRATCIGFGPWTGVGMSARLGSSYERRLTEMGFSPFTFEQGMHVLGQMAQDDQGSVVATALQWPRFLASRAEYARSPMLDAFAVDAPTQLNSNMQGELRVQLSAIPAAQRDATLVTALRQAIAAVLGLADAAQVGRQQRLFDLGLDSMAAMDLREILQRRLGLRLRATVLFDYPSVDALSRFLLHELFAEAEPAPTATRAAFTAAQVEQLSDDEAEALLLAELRE